MIRSALLAIAAAACTNPSPLDPAEPPPPTKFTGTPAEADLVLRDFHFDSGESLSSIASSAPMSQQARFPTRDAADKNVADTEQFWAKHDPNDELYAVSASRDYDPSQDLENIRARFVHINFGDDFINPPELGIAERMIERVPRGRFVLVPGSAQTRGHGTHTWAKFWKQELRGLL